MLQLTMLWLKSTSILTTVLIVSFVKTLTMIAESLESMCFFGHYNFICLDTVKNETLILPS